MKTGLSFACFAFWRVSYLSFFSPWRVSTICLFRTMMMEQTVFTVIQLCPYQF